MTSTDRTGYTHQKNLQRTRVSRQALPQHHFGRPRPDQLVKIGIPRSWIMIVVVDKNPQLVNRRKFRSQTSDNMDR